MTRTTTFYFDSKEVENLYIVAIRESYNDYGNTFVVTYNCNDEDFKTKNLRTPFESLEDAQKSVDVLIDFIKKYNNISHITKQTIIHEDVTETL